MPRPKKPKQIKIPGKFSKLPHSILIADLTAAEFKLWCAINAHCTNGERFCSLPLTYLKKLLRLSERQVRRSLRSLMEKEVVTCQWFDGKPTQYKAMTPDINVTPHSDATPDKNVRPSDDITPDICDTPTPDIFDRGTPDIDVTPDINVPRTKMSATPDISVRGLSCSSSSVQSTVQINSAETENNTRKRRYTLVEKKEHAKAKAESAMKAMDLSKYEKRERYSHLNIREEHEAFMNHHLAIEAHYYGKKKYTDWERVFITWLNAEWKKKKPSDSTEASYPEF